MTEDAERAGDGPEPDAAGSRSDDPEDAQPSDPDADTEAVDPDADAESADAAASEEADADIDVPEGTDADDADADAGVAADADAADDVPRDVREYNRFSKVDGAQYERVNDFLRDRTYITAREWAIARLCADFRTETGVEMTKIGENLPELVPFMTDTYSPQAVNQARTAFEDKVRMAGATFLYGAMSDFFTADELDDLMYEVTEVAKFLLEVEGVDLSVEEELESEERISSVMREVRHASDELRHEGTECPHCGHEIESEADD